MFAISAEAARRMSDLLVPRPDDAVLRIVRRGGRFRLHVSQSRPGDQLFDHDGRPVLALDQATQTSLVRRSLGVRNTTAGPRLLLASR